MKVYTYNDKVLTNSANGKWLKEKEAPVIEEVTIGDQTWMLRNLAIDDGGEGITILNGNYYYTKAAAERVAATITGWHLPTNAEFNIIKSYGFTGLASTDGWTYGGGTNSTGFTALPVGLIFEGTLDGVGTGAYYWTSYRGMSAAVYNSPDGSGVQVATMSTSTDGLSVRLIKDSQ